MSVKTYSYSDNSQLTEHFSVREFRCKCGKSHSILINTDLAEKLEKLHKALICKYIIINSGHRCSAHDIAVGGSGSGQHVNGNAADIVCYDKNGKPISSKIVSCAAQDIGFCGIANIDSSYTATHVDVRSGSKWLGDETVTTAYSVCSDFYSYYKLSKADVYGSSKHRLKVYIDDKLIDDHEFSGLID